MKRGLKLAIRLLIASATSVDDRAPMKRGLKHAQHGRGYDNAESTIEPR